MFDFPVSKQAWMVPHLKRVQEEKDIRALMDAVDFNLIICRRNRNKSVSYSPATQC